MIYVERNQALSDPLEFFEVIGENTGKEDASDYTLFRLSKVFHEKKRDEHMGRRKKKREGNKP